MKKIPPKTANLILRLILRKEEYLEKSGDLEEVYLLIREDTNKTNAAIWYWYQVIKAIPILISSSFFWGITMFKNYFKIAVRNINKQKINSFINISGLAVGITSVILLLLYIQYELSYDKYHDKADRIYRVAFADKESERIGIHIPATISPLLKSRIPAIENSTRLIQKNDKLLSYRKKNFIESNFIFADPEIFEIFSFELLEGNKKNALDNPNSIVLSESMARKYFGSENPIGKTMRFEDKIDLHVSGILKSIPENSHFNVNFIIPFITVKQIWSWIDLESWQISMYNTYFTLQKNSKIDEVIQKLPEIIEKNVDANYFDSKDIFFQPLTDIHLYSQSQSELGENADIQQIYILASITFLILIIAGFNYMNLTTAQSSKRNKEIGIRNVMGANKKQLFRQFIGESFIITVIAFGISLSLAWFLLPYFNNFVGRNLSINPLENIDFFLWLCLLIGLVAFLAGLYPAITITINNPSSLLGAGNVRIKSSKFRNLLILFQFTISIILLIVTLAIKEQMNYIENTEVGFAKDNIVIVDILDDNVSSNKDIIKTNLLKNPNILSVAASSYLPNQSEGMNMPSWAGKPDNIKLPFYFCAVDYDFLDLYGIKLTEGRIFMKKYSSDIQGAVIINETALKNIGWESSKGKEIAIPRFGAERKTMPVVGVAKDFNMLSLHESIAPFFFLLDKKYADTYLSIKTTGSNQEETLKYIQEVIKQFSSSYPVIHYYFEDVFNSYYESEQKLGNIFTLFSLLAIVIACMGLFGLVLTSSIQRTKEIGIRKVFGASVTGIAAKLTSQFTFNVLIANIIAWPVAYYLAKLWLEEFAYRTSPQLWMFLLSGTFVLFIAMAVTSLHTIKAARANPIESIRNE